MTAAKDKFYLPINEKLLLWLCKTNGLLATCLWSCCQCVYMHDNVSEKHYYNEVLLLCVPPFDQLDWMKKHLQ